ncbi:hypothetical protein ASA1KI_20900 [Opitutales bacterium ASA1]|uniref:hypothetical protein n=1 Tax=Congregicoccus parvus TaxID=3081749 RepID=UPI002B2F77D8|nr:hypothetical protein ASA1KI_20900 [Opitutales bacterium ASA1]
MSPDAIAQERREECRRTVLEHLVGRSHVACHPQDIRRALNAGRAHDFDLEEVVSALAFLVMSSPQLATTVRDPMGATVYYQATAAGVLHHERGGRA